MSVAPAIVGVDFSGARDAGRHLWIASGRPSAGRFALRALVRGDELPGGGVARDVALPALVAHVAGLGDAVVGLDVPFALARGTAPDDAWARGQLAWAASFADPLAFRRACARRLAGREPRRACDTAARTPFAPTNLRMFRQTWAALAGVLAPLVGTRRASAAPFQRLRRGRPVLAEVCPASLLRRLGLPGALYKRPGAPARRRRAALLAAVEREGLLAPVPRALRRRVRDDAKGDALDAVLAACAALRAWSSGTLHAPATGVERFEGRVFD